MRPNREDSGKVQTVRLTDAQIRKLDSIVAGGYAYTRSEFMRVAITKAITEFEKEHPNIL